MSASTGNTPLTRVIPLIVWSQNLFPVDLYRAIKADADFTHINLQAQYAVFLYAIALQYLLTNRDDEDRAQHAFDLAKNQTEHIVCMVDPRFKDESKAKSAKKTCENVRKWLDVSAEMHKVLNYKFGEYSSSLADDKKKDYISEFVI